MKRMHLCILCAFAPIILVFACETVQKAKSDPTKTLVGVVYDRSASTGGFYGLSHVHLDSLYSHVERRGGGDFFAVFAQSNSLSQTPIEAVIGDATSLPVTGLNVHQQKIRDRNERKQEQARLERDRFFRLVPQKLLVPQRDSFTDIDQALKIISLAMNEPRFASYRRVVIIISDGIQELQEGHVPIKSIDLNAHEIHLVRPRTEALQEALGQKYPIKIHSTVSEAILSL